MQMQEKDPITSSIKSTAAVFIVRNSVLYKIQNDQDLLVNPEAMQLNIVQDIHNKGRFSSKKTEKNRVSEHLYS